MVTGMISNKSAPQWSNAGNSSINKTSTVNSFEMAMVRAQNNPAAEIDRSSQRITDGVQFSTEAMYCMKVRNVTTDNLDTFKGVINKANHSNSYNDPKAFLNSLSANEMEVLRKVHTLAAPIRVETLDFEGAFNLLLPPGDAQDLNNDGLHSVGLAKSRIFPPPNAPATVQSAFQQATVGQSNIEKAMNMTAFRSFEISANIKYDTSGKPIGVYQPSESNYTDIYSESGFSYDALAKKALENLEKNNGYYTEEAFEQRKAFLEDFIKGINGDKVV